MDFLTGGGRIGRMRFLLTGLLLSASLAVLGQWTTYVHPLTDEIVIEESAYPAIAAYLWLNAMNGVRRLHDRSHSGYAIFFALLPGVNLLSAYLLFAPSSPNSNKWGKSPVANPYRANLQRQKPVTSEEELARQQKRNLQFMNEDGSFDMDGLFRQPEAQA